MRPIPTDRARAARWHRGVLAALGLLATGARGEPGAPVLGVMTHFAQGWDPALADPIAAAGIRDVRDEIYWQDVEPARGQFRFPARDERYMAELAQRGISPLVELTFANRAYDGGLTPYTDEGFDAYARYGVEVLRHYGPQVRAVEIWNEYNGTFCRGPAAKNRAETYARMARVAYRALKAERPDVLVAGAATAGVPLPYLEHLFALGALDSMDAVSIHPYRFNSEPEGIENDVAALQDLIRRYNHGQPKPIWVTEIGWATKAAAAPLDLSIDEGVQADFLVRAYALLLSAGVDRIYWYLFRDYDVFATMGLVHQDRAHTPKRAYHALATLIAQVGGARFARREHTPPDFYALRFERPTGEVVRVVWSLRPRALAVPAACRVTDLVGGPVAAGPAVAVGPEPLYIEGPFAGFPEPDPHAPRRLADSARDFAGIQGANHWSYGVFVGAAPAFLPLDQFHATDWKREWYGRYPYVSLSDREQHPAESPAGPVAAVRRWTCDAGGSVHLHAQFGCGAQGDGVRVEVLLDGQRVFAQSVGGPNPARADFDMVRVLPPGAHVDFAVYPGPRGNANFDATEFSASAEEAQP
jgi:hypothetical protein